MATLHLYNSESQSVSSFENFIELYAYTTSAAAISQYNCDNFHTFTLGEFTYANIKCTDKIISLALKDIERIELETPHSIPSIPIDSSEDEVDISEFDYLF